MGSINEHGVPRATRVVSAMAVGSCGPDDRAYAGVGGCASGRLAAWSLMEGVVWDYKALCDEPTPDDFPSSYPSLV